jgi:hypothetical protein
MKKFMFEGKELEGRIVKVTLCKEIESKKIASMCLVETKEGFFKVMSTGDVGDGDWEPKEVYKEDV